MIKFFRRLRHKLLEENRFSKYVLYAFGEIILVVIGILIALQLNNWNEAQKLKETEKIILADLKGEFLENIESADNSIEMNRLNSQSCVEINNLIQTNTLSAHQQELDSLLVQLGYISSFKPKRGVVDQIINSGKINVLSDADLRALITKLISTIDEAQSESKYAIENYTHNLIPFLAEHFPLANGDLVKPGFDNTVPRYSEPSVFEIDWKKIDLLSFQNMIWHHKHNVDFLLRKDRQLKEEIKLIVDKIEGSIRELERGD